MNRNTMAVIGIVAAVALFGGGYYAGASTSTRAPSATATTTTGGGGGAAGGGGAGAGQPRGAGGAGGAAFNAPVTGRVLSVNADSITIAVANRAAGSPQPGASPVLSSSIALVGATTRVIRTSETDIKLGDLKAGDQITVVGSTDQSTGTISAQAIVVGATNVLGQLFGGGSPGGQGGAPRPSGSPAAR